MARLYLARTMFGPRVSTAVTARAVRSTDVCTEPSVWPSRIVGSEASAKASVAVIPWAAKKAVKASSVGPKTVRRDAGAVSAVSTSAHCVCEAAVTRVARPLSPAITARLALMSMTAVIVLSTPLPASASAMETAAGPPTAGATVTVLELLLYLTTTMFWPSVL